MSGTDYSFDGLDEWEKALTKTIETEYPAEFEKMVLQVAFELQGRVKDKTNELAKKTGRLMNSWTVGGITKKGDEYYIEVYTDVEYAEPVEYGHRKPDGKGFVKGKHMMELSLADVNKALPDYLRGWLNDFLNTHDI